LNQKGDLKYYPICLDVADRSCLVVGGGSVGARKALTLSRCGAQVTVVSPLFSDEFTAFAHHDMDDEDAGFTISKRSASCDADGKDSSCVTSVRDVNHLVHRRSGGISCIKKEYDSDDLDSMFLVIGATDNMDLNRQIARDAKARDILCNIADFPEGSSFVLPSIVQRGDLVITISTSGKSPALAKKVRKELELQFGKEYATFLTLMGDIRKGLLSQNHSPEEHAAIFRELVNSDLLEKIASGDGAGIDNTLKRTLGSNTPDHQLIFGE